MSKAVVGVAGKGGERVVKVFKVRVEGLPANDKTVRECRGIMYAVVIAKGLSKKYVDKIVTISMTGFNSGRVVTRFRSGQEV